MKNKSLKISVILNLLLAILLIVLFYNSLLHKDAVVAESAIQNNEVKINNNRVFKKLPFLLNQSNDFIKEGTSAAIEYSLPAPNIESNVSVEEAMFQRRSKRSYTQSRLLPYELSQILWAAYGVTSPLNNLGDGLKTCPSADGRYPLSIYVLVGDVQGLPKGVYKYVPAGHKLLLITEINKKTELSAAAYNEQMIEKAPAVLVYTGIPEQLLAEEKEVKLRWTNMEVGHSAENVYLQATALNMGTCAIGSFESKKVKQVLNIPQNEQVLYIMPLGHI